MNQLFYRTSRIIFMLISVYLSLQVAKCNILYSTLYVSIIFLILDIYFPRIDYD